MDEFIAIIRNEDGISIAEIAASAITSILDDYPQFKDINPISDEKIIEYTGQDSLKSKEIDDWCRIELKKHDQENLANFFSKPRVNFSYSEFSDVDYIAYSTELCVNIEKVFKVKGKGKSGLYCIDNQIEYHPNVSGVAITGIISAKYYPKSPYLYFKHFNLIKHLLINPEEYDPEASVKEIEDFKSYKCLNFVKVFKFGARNKKKIKLFMELSDSKLDDSSNHKIFQEYAASHGITLFNDEWRIDINNNKRLNEVLDVLNRYYYSDPISDDSYLAGSRKQVNHEKNKDANTIDKPMQSQLKQNSRSLKSESVEDKFMGDMVAE